MARKSAQAVADVFDAGDIDPTDITDVVEVGDDIDAWMNEMLSGPTEDDLW